MRKPALPGGLSKLVTGLTAGPLGTIAAPNLARRRRPCQTEIAVSVNGRGLPVAIQPERRITMAQENCAQGAPRGSFAHAPTGFRRMTPGLLKADRTAEGFAGPAGGRNIARAAACRLQGGSAAARHRAAPGARGRLAVPLHPAAGLGAGQPADRMALGLDAAGGARPLADAGQGDQPAPDRARPRDDEGQPERQALRHARPRRAASSKPMASICRRSPCATPNSSG